jgi:hypothetical protein
MKKEKAARKSICGVCGKRLSEKTASGAITWHPSHVDDTGIYCLACRPPEKNKKVKKNSRT